MYPRLSVIIPIYNAEKYLSQCLDSVTQSTFRELEIICVDDGSTDQSVPIIKHYAEKDSRIKMIRQQNQYAGAARNTGLRQAAAEYVHFLDADDWISPDAYSEWYAIAKDKEADVCVCFHEKYDDLTKKTTRTCHKLKDYVTVTNFAEKPCYFIYNAVVPWNKLYKRKFLLDNDITFDHLICANDRSFYFHVLLKAACIVIIQEYWMHYRMNNSTSLTGEIRLKNYDCHFRSFEKIQALTENCDPDIKKMILDVSIADFINFYQKGKNTVYEKKITQSLYDFFSQQNLSLLKDTICSKNWFPDYLQILLSKTPETVRSNVGSFYAAKPSIPDKTPKITSEQKKKNTSNFHNKALSPSKNHWGLTDVPRSPQLIVTLTSYPPRIPFVHKTIETLLNQTIKPDKLILWLAEEQFPLKEEELPDALLKLKAKGLTICWCEDLRAYKKLIPALRQYPHDILVTADDDAYYAENWLELLYRDYEKFKYCGNYIYCHRVTKFFKPDDKWHIISANRSVWPQPTYLHKLVGLGGVLYPPYSLYRDIFDTEKFQALAPTNDDIWFWFMALLNGRKIKLIAEAIPCPVPVEGSQEVGSLCKINDSGEKLFWKDFASLLKAYPEISGLLEREYDLMHGLEKLERIPSIEKNETYFKNLPWNLRPAQAMFWYFKRTGQYLNLDFPKTFNEKIQWLKLYNSTSQKTLLADKYRVRKWIQEKIGESHLIPLLGVWHKFDDIDFTLLPNQFVLKTNHGSGWNILVHDKEKFDIDKAKTKFDDWTAKNFGARQGQELHYWNIPPLIIAEKYIDEINNLLDYKFLCFNGEVKYIWVDSNRYTDHRRDFFDLKWNHLNITQAHPWADTLPQKPCNLTKMLEIATTLSQGFAHVRVDLYNVNGKIYFGEMTFTSANGGEKTSSPKFDRELGDHIILPSITYPALK